MTQASLVRQYTTRIQVRSHELTADEPTDKGGLDKGPDPHELVESALAACTAITLQMYANRKGWPLESTNVTVKFVKTEQNRDAIAIERTLDLYGNLDDEQKKRLLEIAEKCPIHQVLARGAQIQTRLAK
jgi:putative redox protein